MEVAERNGTTPAEFGASELATPFLVGGDLEGVTAPSENETAPGWLSSPFAEAFAADATEQPEAVLSLAAELEDLEFEDSVQRLVDEVAAQHLSTSTAWSSEAASVQADRQAELWLEAIAGEADGLFEHLAAEFGDRETASVSETEIATAARGYLGENPSATLAGEEFLGGLIRKATKLVKGVGNLVKRGIAAAGRLLPIGRVFDLLRRLVRPLLRRVLRTAINKLPVALREPATMLAGRLTGEGEQVGAGEAVAGEFDARLAEAVVAGNELEADRLVGELEGETAGPLEAHDPVTDLDAGRARLTERLLAASPGEAPTAEVEQFVPAVMAAMPLLRLGVSAVGRDRIVAFLGDRLADLVKAHVGADMARKLGRPLADAGLRLLSLETGADTDAQLGAEALVATMEDTIREVASLPTATAQDPLRLEAELQHAFTDAAARHLPRSVLRDDLADHEVAGEAGVWVFMPRRPMPRYRYKKYSRVLQVPVTRPMARTIVLSDGGTLEGRLLDGGIRAWPAETEVHLYETMPGTQLGHLASFENENPGGEATGLSAEEFEELTPEIAGLLAGEPGLGRQKGPGIAASSGAGLVPGTRLYRLKVGTVRTRPKRHRFIVRFDPAAGRPVLRVHLWLSEREAHQVAGAVQTRSFVRIVALVRGLLGVHAHDVLARRLARQARRRLQADLGSMRAHELASAVVEGMLSSLSKDVVAVAPLLEKAASDAAAGLTLTYTFQFADIAGVQKGAPGSPKLDVRAGSHRD